jgi:hypothetical protein
MGNAAVSKPIVPPTPPVSTPSMDPVDPKFNSFVNLDRIIAAIKNAIASNRTMSFTDVSSHWDAEDIRIAAKLGVSDGYPDGSFKPDEAVTRGEFSKLLVEAFDLTAGSTPAEFRDKEGNWAQQYIQILASNGVINGYEDGTFKPDNGISRAEIMAMLSRIANFKALKPGPPKTFTDIGPSYWAKEFIEDAAGAGMIQGIDDNLFAPDRDATRAESLTLTLRTIRMDSTIRILLESIK